MKKILTILLAAIIAILTGFTICVLMQDKEPENNPSEILEQVGNALGDEYKKQTVSEVVAKLTYTQEDGSDPIYYYFVKTTYYEADPAEVTGLNEGAFCTLFNPDDAETTEIMMVQDWNGCLYTLPEKSFLCWTVSPEISYIMEYNPDTIADNVIIKMAESVAPIESSG